MSSGTAKHPNADRSYWLSRQWVYQSYFGPSRRDELIEPAAKSNDSESTLVVEAPADPKVREILTRGKTEPGNSFLYAGSRTAIRPMTRRLLNIMSSAGGRNVSIARIARELWGRSSPPSANTLYIAVFRVNAALRAVKCPLKLCVRLTDLCFICVETD